MAGMGRIQSLDGWRGVAIAPAEPWPRLRFCFSRYGVLHTVARYFFSHAWPAGWPLVAPTVTRPYLEKWRSAGGARILNLGGGGNLLPGCLTVDIHPAADCYVDIRKALPFADASVDAIFCEEAIEHIARPEAEACLRECARILKPGGVMRITTPDLDHLASTLASDPEACDRLNTMFYDCEHRYLYSRAELARVATRAGFADCVRSSYRDPRSRLGYLDSHPDRWSHPSQLSQYVELLKK